MEGHGWPHRQPTLTEDWGRQCVELYGGDVTVWHTATKVGIQVRSGGDAQVAFGNCESTLTQARGDAQVATDPVTSTL